MSKYFRISTACAFAMLLSLSACGGKAAENAAETGTPADSVRTAVVYYCPMKCEEDKTYPEPGTCPVCDMDLVAAE